jgi:threonine/homoserine/homoserine lactone efflux protein
MIDYSLLFAYFLAILLFLGTPGPVTVLVVSASVKSGFKAGLATVAGTNTASLILIAISFIILQGVFSVSETAIVQTQ